MEEDKSSNEPCMNEEIQSPTKMSERQVKLEIRNIYKNIILIGIAFFCNYTSYTGLSRLQSSLHIDEGMGVINQSILYGALVVSTFILPALLINTLGHKWTTTLSLIGYISWMLANGHAVWATMVPTSILLGVCGAPLWASQSAYFNILCKRYTELTGEAHRVVISRFFGILFCFFQMAGISGSIISSAVLKSTPDNTTAYAPSEEVLQFCGVRDCPNNNVSNPNLQEVDSKVLWNLVLIYTSVAVAAFLILAIFVDNIPKHVLKLDEKDSQRSIKQQTFDLIMATVKLWRHRELILLIPLSMYSGFEYSFYEAEFSKSFISCSAGIWKVGLITIPYGVVNAIVSLFIAFPVKYIGRVSVFTIGLVIDLSIQLTLMYWMPSPDEEYVLLILSGLWGITDAIWQTQLNSLYGDLFLGESEAAFSNYWMFRSYGFIIPLGYSSSLCTATKLYVLPAILGLGMTGYYLVEFLQRRRRLREETDRSNSKEIVKMITT